MVEFIFGRTGYGKSAELYARMRSSAARGRRVWLVVPEQEAVNAERRVAALYSDEGWIEDENERRAAVRRIEVTTFSRLADEAARAAGRIDTSRLDGGAVAALAYRSLTEAAGELKTDFFASLTGAGGLPQVDAGALSSLSSLISALRGECVGPDRVEKAAETLRKDNDSDCGRLFDLAAIYRRFISSDRLARDAEGRLAKLISDLGKINIFRGCDVYIDRFYTYTGQEYSVLRHMAEANSLTVTVPADRPDSAEEIFAPAIAAYEKICDIANEAGVQSAGVKICGKPARFKSRELSFLSENFSSGGFYPKDAPVTAVKAAECGDVYREAEYVANEILGIVHSGGRFSDCAAVVRDAAGYRGVCDAVFSRRGIPCFTSKRTDAQSKPPVKYLTAALSAVAHGFRREDALSWLKTGLCGISEEETSQLVSYINLWDLSGRKLAEKEFVLSPDGFAAKRDGENDGRLEELTRIRDAAFAPLLSLRAGMGGAGTVGEKCRALYDFLILSGMPEKIAGLADAAKSDGDAKEAADLSRLWKAICDTLDTLYDVLGDLDLGKTLSGTEHFRRLLAAVFTADIGGIPTANDEVVIADAALTRLGDIKHVFVMGAEEGAFSRSGEDDPFSPVRDQLLRGGIDLHGGIEEYWQTENYRFYNAICAASETLTLTYVKHDAKGEATMASEAFCRVTSIFSITPENGDLLPPSRRLFSRDDFIREAASTGDEELTAALRKEFSKPGNEGYGERLGVALLPLTAKECSAEGTAGRLFSGTVRLSPSRLSDYLSCGFYYFCNSVLKLKEKKPAVFDPPDLGSCVHAMMEKGVKYALSDGYSEAGLEKLLLDVSDEYFAAVYGKDVTKRMRASAEQLVYLARAAVADIKEEFSQSSFKPVAYEVAIGGRGGLPSYRIENADAELTGRIDRLDAAAIDGKTYVRVVDYKTGRIYFRGSGISKTAGLGEKELPKRFLDDSQLILYLFAVTGNGGRGIPGVGGEVAPAGVIYLPVGGDTSEKAAKGRQGCLLDDIDVLRAMEPDLGGNYIPIKETADGRLSAQSRNYASKEEFGRIKEMAENAVASVANDLRRGRMDADPLNKSEGSSAEYKCKNCGMWPVCRCKKDGTEDGDEND